MHTDEGISFQQDLLEWAEENERTFPWRRRDADLYEVFIAEFFLTQTPAEAVADVYPDFLQQYPSIEAIESATTEELVEVIRPLGLYNRRARALLEIADRVEGDLPRTSESLESLPRVGPYVANATTCFALDEQLPVIDTNVRRIYGRIFGDDWPSDLTSQKCFAGQLLPEGSARSFNLALLDFGSSICVPSNPDCEECFAKSYCDFYQNEGDS